MRAGAQNNEFFSGLKPLMGAMIGAGCGLSSISFYTHGAFVVSISSNTGWSRGDVQLGVSIMILMAIITAPIVGVLVDRFGARRVALISIPLYGLSMGSFYFLSTSLSAYYLAWSIMSVLAAGTLPVTWTRVVNGWFDKHRGIALGITLAGTGFAATLAPTYVTWLITEFGWQKAYLLLALTITLIGFPGVYFLFFESKNNNSKESFNKEQKETNTQQSISFRAAIMSYHFWAIGIALVLAAAAIAGLITNSVPMLIDQGKTLQQAAKYAGLIGLSVISGRLVVGFLVDHFWAPLIAAIFLTAPIFSIYVFSIPTPSITMVSLAMIVIGLAAGAELDLLAFLVSRYFGLHDYGKLYGALYVFFSIGAGLAPAAFGMAFDHFGNYALVLKTVAIMSAISGILMLSLGKYPTLKTS
jgi:MFS family permease